MRKVGVAMTIILVRSLDVCWPPDPERPGSEMFTCVRRTCIYKICEKSRGVCPNSPRPGADYLTLFEETREPRNSLFIEHFQVVTIFSRRFRHLHSYAPLCVSLSEVYSWNPGLCDKHTYPRIYLDWRSSSAGRFTSRFNGSIQWRCSSLLLATEVLTLRRTYIVKYVVRGGARSNC